MKEVTKLYQLLGMVDEKHFRWATNNYLKIFPQTLIETYGSKKMVNGRKRGVTQHYCEIMIEINGKCKRVADLPHLHQFLEDGWKFQQTDKLYETIRDLYKYYYERANDSRPI